MNYNNSLKFLYITVHEKNDFAERSKILLNTVLKIIYICCTIKIIL